MTMIPRSVLVSPEFRSLRPSDVIVLLLLDTYARGDTGQAWPLQSRLAGEAGLTPESVSRSTERLVGAGFLRKDAHPSDPRRVLYTVLAPPSCRVAGEDD